ncbi:MAG: DM13 domain-containing protein [Bacteroidota bacterium]
MNKLIIPTFISLMLTACIGTDILEEEIFPERVQITTFANSIKVGENFKFEAVFFGATGEIEDVSLTWGTADENVINVAQNGEATALAEGMTYVIVNVGDIRDSVAVTAGGETVVTDGQRTGEFVGLNNYSVEGNFSMELVGTTTVRLNFSENFRVSNGPGLYVYLSNNDNSVSGGLELGKLSATSGAQSYEFDQPDLFNAYSYVIIYCKPFGVPFGRGTFTN